MSDREEDTVANLLRLAGPRPSLPAESTERAREAVHAAWRGAVRARRRRHALAWGGAAALAAGVAFLGLRGIPVVPKAPAPPAAPIMVATVERALEARSFSAGRALFAGELVASGRGRLALRTTGGVSLRLDEGTRVRLLGARQVALDEGALYLDAVPGRDGGFVVETPLGRVTDEGTQFEGRLLDGGLRLRVREGRVTLRTPRGQERVETGEELRAGEGPSVRARIATTGPEWAWAIALAEAPAIDGRPLRGFLDWAAREEGLALRFHDAAARASADRVLLRGSIEGLTPREAMEAVIPTTGLRARVEGPSLRMESR